MKFPKSIKWVLLYCILIIVIIIALLTATKKESLESCFTREPEFFQLVADTLIEIQAGDDFPILIDRTDYVDNQLTHVVASQIPENISQDMESILFDIDCFWIFASETREGTGYCVFESFSRDLVTGIAFVGDNTSPDTNDPILRGEFVNEMIFIADGWVYFEYLTHEAASKIPG